MKSIDRRKFIGVCGSYVAALTAFRPQVTSAATAQNRQYNRVLLKRGSKPIRAGDFEPGQVFIFHYPYVSTPCLIFNLGEPANQAQQLVTESGTEYTWTGGFGPDQSIVAYSAICAHRMTYPAKSASFFNYRHSKAVYFDTNRTRQEREKVIYCCSERSVYDPKKGAQVMGGPAPQPLAAIEVEYSAKDDTLTAIGASGGELFSEFMDRFKFRLQLDFGIDDVAELTSDSVELQTIEEFSKVVMHC